jgi:SAM-dependent methyltransferase
MSAWTVFVGSINRHFRRRRAALFERHAPGFPQLRVCDLGGSLHFWESMPRELVPSDLTILNIAVDGQSQSHSGTLSGLAITLFDGERIPFPDKHFDVLICNSVIEHVPVEARAAFVRELERVSKYYFVQTPAFEFPVEPHFVLPFLHWLPRAVGRRLVPFGLWALLGRPTRAHMDSYFDEVNLLTYGEMRARFPAAHIHRERFLGLPKSYVAHAATR